jgi:hypothetical protein
VHDPVGGTGAFVAHAVCVKGSDLRYVRRAAVTVVAGASTQRNVPCRNEEHVVGGGARLSGLADEARLVSSVPYDDGDTDLMPDDGWRVRADNVAGADKELKAFATCLS